ncbi:hypothetical protein ACP275_11G122800 [Erythranthe tilingii]
MSQDYANQFPIENPPLINIIQLVFLIVGLVESIVFVCVIIDTKKIQNFFVRCNRHRRSEQLISSKYSKEDSDPTVVKQSKRAAVGDDIVIVLRSLGMFDDSDKTSLLETSYADIAFDLFEERSPCLDEVKEAFDVFDENRDGFIDAKELHKVLCALGLNEGLEMENCRRMIGVFDENGDGRIDFDEFVKFMEINFC